MIINIKRTVNIHNYVYYDLLFYYWSYSTFTYIPTWNRKRLRFHMFKYPFEPRWLGL